MHLRNLSFVLWLAAWQCGFAGQGLPRISKDPATCYDAQTGDLKGSEIVRTPILTSADRKWRAYAQNEARASDPGVGGPECQNVSKLYIAAPGHRGFRRVYTELPREQEQFNLITLVDWSPDDRYLLLNEFFGQWGSDAGGSVVRIYDTLTGTISDERLVQKALAKRAGKECSFAVSPRGFSAVDRIAIELYPVRDEEGHLESDNCVRTPALWLLDPDREVATRLSPDYKVQQYGRFDER